MKRFISIFLLLTLFINIINVNNNVFASTQLSDIQNHWGKDYIERLVDQGAVNGYPDGTFKPNGTISRAAFITVLAKALDLTPNQSNYFEDTGKHWAKTYISAAVDAGIINMKDYSLVEGYQFDPNVDITREEMAQIITRALGEEYEAQSLKDPDFRDVSLINSRLKGYVSAASKNGIITGYPDGRFAPTASATRAEACVMVTRLLDKLDENPNLEVMDSEDIYNLYSKAMVIIIGTDEEGVEYKLGSGIVIEKSGKILTNFHVINGTTTLAVEFLDGTKKKVESLHNYDRTYDTAILNIEKGQYDSIPIGNSRRLNIGERIYTLGFPLVMNLSISDGLVSSFVNDGNGHNYIQISAPISPGSSGGALIDKYGRVVGITTASFIYGENMNLAIPIDDVLSVMLENNKSIDVKSATLFNDKFSDELINGKVEAFGLFGAKDADITSKTYDYVLNMSDYDYLGYTLNLSHNVDIIDNSWLGYVVISDSLGDYVYSEYFLQRIYKGASTNKSHTLNLSDIDVIGEGRHKIELYLGDEKIAEDWFVLKSDLSYDSYNPVSTSISIFDYDTYMDTDYEVANPTTVFKENSTSTIGFEISGKFEEPFEETTNILYEILINGDNGFVDNFYTTGKVKYDESTFSVKSGYGNRPGFYPSGEYKVFVQYNKKVIATTSFTVINDMEAEIFQFQKEQVRYYDYDKDIDVATISIQDQYELYIPIKLGTVSKDTKLISNCKFRSSNPETEDYMNDINECCHYLTKENSNSSYEIGIYYFRLEKEFKRDYINGYDVYIDILINDDLYGTIKYEANIPEVGFEVLDAFIYGLPSEELHTNYYTEKYDVTKGYEKDVIDISENNYLYYAYTIEADEYEKYRMLVDYVYVELVSADTGEVIETAFNCYNYVRTSTLMDAVLITDNLQESGIKPGDYIFNVYTLDKDQPVFTKQYTFVE